MADQNPEPFDAFDARLARTMRAFTDRAIVPVVPADLARTAMATDRPSGRAWRPAPVGLSRVGWAAAVWTLVALALLGGMMVAGALAPSTVQLSVVPPSPSASSPAALARLVFVRDNDIWIAATDGSHPTQIVAGDFNFTSEPSDVRWLPTGRRIAVRNDTQLLIFTDKGRGIGGFPIGSRADDQIAWAPDGTEVAMLHRHGPLEILSLDGRPTRTLPLPEDFGFTYDLPGIAWSPDGRSIALAGCTGCTEKGVANELWLDAADGSGLTNLSETPGHYTPSWSPDGKLYFGLGSVGSGDVGLAEINPDGSGFRRLYGLNDWIGAIEPSPDGSRVALRANFAGSVVTVNADGSQPVIAEVPRGGPTVRWSVDGRLLTTTDAGVVEFDPDGGNLRVLVAGATAFDLGGSR